MKSYIYGKWPWRTINVACLITDDVHLASDVHRIDSYRSMSECMANDFVTSLTATAHMLIYANWDRNEAVVLYGFLGYDKGQTGQVGVRLTLSMRMESRRCCLPWVTPAVLIWPGSVYRRVQWHWGVIPHRLARCLLIGLRSPLQLNSIIYRQRATISTRTPTVLTSFVVDLVPPMQEGVRYMALRIQCPSWRSDWNPIRKT